MCHSKQRIFICAPKFGGCGRVAAGLDWKWRFTGSMFWEDEDGDEDEQHEMTCPSCGAGEETIKLMNPDPVRDFGLGQSNADDDWDDESSSMSPA